MFKSTYSQVFYELIFKIMLLGLDPGLLIALQKQVHGSVSAKHTHDAHTTGNKYEAFFK